MGSRRAHFQKLALKKTLMHTLWLQRGYLKGDLAPKRVFWCNLALKVALFFIFWLPGHFEYVFWFQRRHLSLNFGSQKGIYAHFWLIRDHFFTYFWLPGCNFCMFLLQKRMFWFNLALKKTFCTCFGFKWGILKRWFGSQEVSLVCFDPEDCSLV